MNKESDYMLTKYHHATDRIDVATLLIKDSVIRQRCGEFIGESAAKKTQEELNREKDIVLAQIFKMALLGAMTIEIMYMIMYYYCLCYAEEWRMDLTKARGRLHVKEYFEKYNLDYDEDFA